MKTLSFLATLSLLALAFPLIIAHDPSQVQDICVAVNTPVDSVYVNGKFCKDPSLATIDDFYFTGLNKKGKITNVPGFDVVFGNVDNIPGLNTLGISFARVDIRVNGEVPIHYHPRASEILGVSKGTLLVGFITEDLRLFSRLLNEGDVIAFPQGLIHFAANAGTVPAVAFGALNSQNPGTIFIADTVFGSNPPLNSKILAKAFQLNITTIKELQEKFNPSHFSMSSI